VSHSGPLSLDPPTIARCCCQHVRAVQQRRLPRQPREELPPGLLQMLDAVPCGDDLVQARLRIALRDPVDALVCRSETLTRFGTTRCGRDAAAGCLRVHGGNLRPTGRLGRGGERLAERAPPEVGEDVDDNLVVDQTAPDAAGVLADVLSRDGAQLSATQTWQQALADADHLAVLHAIWTAETTPVREHRYLQLLAAALPAGYELPASHQAKWLWRTLRSAELAGLDARQVLADAIGERDLAGARDIPAVIDARIRRRTGTPVPLPPLPWSAQVPGMSDPERRAYATEIAALMDARKERIGEHAAASTPPWAVAALGLVPEDPLARLEWQQRAASIGAYRELSGHHHPADPIGPEPAATSPDLHAAWHRALAVLGSADGPDVRGVPACPTWTTSRPKPALPTGACWKPNVPARAPSLRAQPLSGSRTPP
jgi:hypothetical protein